MFYKYLSDIPVNPIYSSNINLLLCVNIIDYSVTFFNENLEVMIIDYNVLGTKPHLWNNRKCDCPLIIFMHLDWIKKNTSQNPWSVLLKFK